MRRDLILGPPGTGKTYTLMREIESLRAEGFMLHEIGFVSFTRRAIREASERAMAEFGLDEKPPWFRTLHSTFWQLGGFGRGNQRITHTELREFSAEFGYQISEDDDHAVLEEGVATVKNKLRDDPLKAAHEWARARRAPLEQAAGVVGVPLPQLRAYARAWTDWKRRNVKADHTDCLERAVEQRTVVPVRALIVDEAQDLNPLQIQALAPTLACAEVVLVAGDDDQAIFTYSGAEPEWIMGLAASRAWRTRVLSQSYRVPRAVHAVAESTVRTNTRRVAKVYAPVARDGEVVRGVTSAARELAAHIIDGPQKSGAVLCRTRKATGRHVDDLFRRQELPYIVAKGVGPNPLGPGGVAEAVTTCDALVRGETVPRDEIVAALKHVPSRGSALKHGAKTRCREARSVVTPEMHAELGLAEWVEHGRQHGHLAMLSGLAPDVLGWLESMWRRYGRVPEPCVTVSTIHGVKGAEYDVVVVDPTTNGMIERNRVTDREQREAENRVAYVAVTRARHVLAFMVPAGPHAHPYP